MPRGGGGGRSGSRSGGFRSSRFRSGSRSSGTSSKSPSAPDEVVVRYSKGGPVRVVRCSDLEGAAFERDLYSEYDKYGSPVDVGYPPAAKALGLPDCKGMLMIAIKSTLFEGSENFMSKSSRSLVKDICGVKVNIDALKNGSTGIRSVQN